MMMRPQGLFRCRNGFVTIEFALLVPAFLMMVFELVEVSRFMWTKQIMSEVAYSTARCMSVSSTCNTSSKQQAYAINLAAGSSLSLANSDLTFATATSCKSNTSSNSVTITKTYAPMANSLVPVPSSITVTSCFPVLS